MAYGGGIYFGGGGSGGVDSATAETIAQSVANHLTGWGLYEDTQYTSGNRFNLMANERAALPNNAATKFEGQLPADVSTFYDPTIPAVQGTLWSDFNIQINFMASMVDPNASYLRVDVDVGPAGSSILLMDSTRTLPWGTGQLVPMTFLFWGYCDPDMIANGAKLHITCDGDVDLFGFAMTVRRTHKGS